MRGSSALRTSVAPGGALAGPWARNPLWTRARAVPSLDLCFADTKSLVCATTGQNLVSHTRASSGTFVGSDGVLRTATTNLLLRSEELATSPWFSVNVTLTNNSTDVVDPAGGNKSTKIVATGSGSSIGQGATISAASTGSIWLRTASGTATFTLIIYLAGAPFTNIGTQSITVTSTWQRFSVTSSTPPSAASYNFQLNTMPAATLYAWGAQLEQSATVGEYIPTTSTINSAPRFDHNPQTGESLGLLVEEARTNLITYSEVVDIAPWGLASATAVANNGVAPDGNTTADKIVSTGGGVFRAGVSVANTTIYTYSVFLKHVTGTGVASAVGFERFGSTPLAGNSSFNLITGTVVLNGANVQSSSITRYPNNWFRVSVTATSTDVTTTVVNYAAASGNEFLVWGAQLEVGAFPTSYIPTTSATVTRAADVASITGANFSSWYNQTEGTVFAEGNSFGFSASSFPTFATISDGTNSNKLEYGYLTSSLGGYIVRSGNATVVEIYPNITANPRRAAFAAAANNYAVSYNGASPTVDIAGAMPVSASQMQIGNGFGGGATNNFFGTIRRLTYWPTRLGNEVLQRITQP